MLTDDRFQLLPWPETYVKYREWMPHVARFLVAVCILPIPIIGGIVSIVIFVTTKGGFIKVWCAVFQFSWKHIWKRLFVLYTSPPFTILYMYITWWHLPGHWSLYWLFQYDQTCFIPHSLQIHENVDKLSISHEVQECIRPSHSCNSCESPFHSEQWLYFTLQRETVPSSGLNLECGFFCTWNLDVFSIRVF